MMVLTMFLVLTTCNTWTGVCEPPIRSQWSIPIPEWGTPTEHLRRAIEECRVKGTSKALELSGTFDPFGDKHGTTNVECTHELGRGT